LKAVKVPIDNSRSVTGKHEVRTHLYLIKDGKTLVAISPSQFKNVEPSKPTYARGDAAIVTLVLNEADYLVLTRTLRNLRGEIKARIFVIDSRGCVVTAYKYERGILRKSFGQNVVPKSLLQDVAIKSGLVLKHTNLNTGASNVGSCRDLKIS